jgi:hypothetical protein
MIAVTVRSSPTALAYAKNLKIAANKARKAKLDKFNHAKLVSASGSSSARTLVSFTALADN